MAIEGEEQATLHDAVTAAFDAVIPDAEATPQEAPASTPAPEAAPTTTGAADERPRGPDGKFVPKSSDAPVRAKDNKGFVSAAPAKASTPEKPTEALAPTQGAAEPDKTPLMRPSSWKKEMWPLWDKLVSGHALTSQESLQLAQYNLQRETEAARGVSTYKAEYDRAKPLVQAYEPHRADFERWGIEPGAQFARYIEIHKGLALGNEDQKLGTLLRLAQDYKIPVEKLFVQQNGQVFYNPQVQPQAPQPQTQLDPQAIERHVQTVIAKERTAAEIKSMEEDTQKYPHFETLRPTMAQLLEAGIASDLPGAYDTALALPQHRELAQAALQQAQAADEAARKAKQAADAQRARAAAVSPRSATPASGAANAQKGRREVIAESLDALTSNRM